MKNDFTNKMTLKYAVALGLIALLSIASYFTIKKVISSQETSAAVINVTNKQRFLCQNVAVYSLCLVNTKDPAQVDALRQEILATVDSIEQAHKGLLYGDPSLNLSGKQSPQVHAFYFAPPMNLDAQVCNYTAEAKTLAHETATELNALNTHLQYILSDFASDLVDAFSSVVNQLQKESEESNKKLQLLEAAVLGVTLFTLLIIAFYLFRPMVNKIKQESSKLLKSEARTRLIIDNATEGIVTFSQEGTTLSVNPATLSMFGYPLADIISKHVNTLLTKSHYSKLNEYITRVSDMDDGNASSCLIALEAEGKRSDGATFPIEFSLNKFYQEEKPVYLMTMRDVTEKKNVEQRLKLQYEVTKVLATSKTIEETTKRILQSLCETLGWHLGLFWKLDNKNNHLSCADIWSSMPGQQISDKLLPHQQTLSLTEGIPGAVCSTKKPVWIPDVLSGQHSNHTALAKKYNLRGVFAFPVSGDEELLGVFELYSHGIQQTDNNILNIMNILGSHIGQYFMRKHSEKQLELMATHDTLTGLFNRRRFHEELEKCLTYSRRYGTCGALLFIDLDKFKYVNDTFGHQVGDELLINISSELKKRLRQSDVLARLGGDEFVAILSPVDESHAANIAKKIVETVHQRGMYTQGHSTGVTASIGMAFFPRHGDTADALISCADQAMYRTKERGRNGYCVFSDQNKW